MLTISINDSEPVTLKNFTEFHYWYDKSGKDYLKTNKISFELIGCPYELKCKDSDMKNTLINLGGILRSFHEIKRLAKFVSV